MDERIWKTELTPAQIRQMMNQEIKNTTGNVEEYRATISSWLKLV
jgi:hypothetical protein